MGKLLTEAQLKTEIARCEYCETKPCREACPATCSPTDFIMAAQQGADFDYKRAAAEILSKNPLGAVCGAVCPKKHCMSGCVHKDFDYPINIPAVQLTIIQKARAQGCMPEFVKPLANKQKIAVIGAGPAGLAAAAVLAQQGYVVTVFEKEDKAGGACWQIPEARLDKEILKADLEFIAKLGSIDFQYNQAAADYENLAGEFAAVIICTGKDSVEKESTTETVFYAGDAVHGRTTVVAAIASGKNAAQAAMNFLADGTGKPENTQHSTVEITGSTQIPVSLETDFFGRKIISPFLLSAAPHTDGYDQVKKAYEAGWAGVVMKTAFDNVPIHIPNEYMFAFNKDTYANCDNVSGHPLDRVCGEVARLVKEFPERLTMAGTGGPLTGDDESDKKGWQSNTLKLEQAGAMGVEYSLSCPQGGDGTEGDIVSQNAALAAKIIDWVMEMSNPEVPKLFKLTGAVTSIVPIVNAIKEVFAKYPNKKAGITLANSFPTLGFRKHKKAKWQEAAVVGMSGEGVAPISFLTLAKACPLGVAISGNGGVMNYKSAANFLALGVKTVQACTIAMKYGVNIIGELNSGLSHLLQERGLNSVAELIGCALPEPITDFMDLTPVKKISAVTAELCEHCGNCTRCPYQAITLNKDKVPAIDPSKCIGCSICVQKCFAGALKMRERTEVEQKVCHEE